MTAVLAYPQHTSYAARRMREAISGNRPNPTPIREYHAWPPATFAPRGRVLEAPVTTLVVHERPALAEAVEAIAFGTPWPVAALGTLADADGPTVAWAPLADVVAAEAAAEAPATLPDPVMLMDDLEALTTVRIKTLGIYRLTIAVRTTAGRDIWAARCLTHPRWAATTPTMKSATTWRDEATSWCPDCAGASA